MAALAYPSGMGMGDVKLAGVPGLFLGRLVGPAMLVALLAAGTVVGVAVIARRGGGEGRKIAVPFGPVLALGGLIGLFAGDAVVEVVPGLLRVGRGPAEDERQGAGQPT